MNAQRIKLNLIPGGVIPVVNVSQYDVGRPLEFALYDGPTVATIEAGTVIDIRATKPDGRGFEYACTWSGNVASIATQAQMTVLSGSIECELHLVKNSQEIGTANFILEVESAALRSDTDISETELPDIIDMARSHEEAAAASAEAAAASESNAADSASAAATSESNAADSASAAATSESNAADSASAAATSESNAADSASAAATSESNAAESKAAAATSKSDAEAYAVGKRGGVDVPSTDPTYNNNAKHYSEVAQHAAAGGIIPKGTTTFAQLPALTDSQVGDMWNISDDFTTTSDFREGAGKNYEAGSNVYKTADNKWDVMGGTVTPRSYIGMIIHSTTLDTMQKVIDFYGGTTWILHDGYMLRGALSGVISNRAQSDGGQDTVTPSGSNSGGAVGSHTLMTNELPSHNHIVSSSPFRYDPNHSMGLGSGAYTHFKVDDFNTNNKGGGQSHTHGFTQPTFTGDAHTNLPAYKNVYIWERTA